MKRASPGRRGLAPDIGVWVVQGDREEVDARRGWFHRLGVYTLGIVAFLIGSYHTMRSIRVSGWVSFILVLSCASGCGCATRKATSTGPLERRHGSRIATLPEC